MPRLCAHCPNIAGDDGRCADCRPELRACYVCNRRMLPNDAPAGAPIPKDAQPENTSHSVCAQCQPAELERLLSAS